MLNAHTLQKTPRRTSPCLYPRLITSSTRFVVDYYYLTNSRFDSLLPVGGYKKEGHQHHQGGRAIQAEKLTRMSPFISEDYQSHVQFLSKDF
jgi:hypothetical protein